MRRLAVITSHPIQYNAPLFRIVAERNNIAIKVFYTLERTAVVFDRDFGKIIEWDLPLLEGYNYSFVSNNGSKRRDFWGVRNPTLEKEIENWDADAILVYGWNFYSHFRAMRYFKKRKKVLFRGDSTLLDDKPGIKSFLRKAFLKWVYSYIDKALFTGKHNREYFRACGLKEFQLVPAPHSVDNNRFRMQAEYNKTKSLLLRRQLMIPDEAIVLLFAGKFQEKKAPMFLLETFLKFMPENFHLLFIGDGKLKDNLISRANGNSKVHFRSFQNQSEMPIIYQLCDIYCLPSQGPGETWGLAVNEAMACGKAILVSDKVGCAPDLVINGVNGFIFKSGDELDLYGKFINMNDKQKLIDMGKQSLKIIQSFTMENLAACIEEEII